VRSWLEHHAVRVEEGGPPLAEPVDGGATLHRLLDQLRAPDPAGRGSASGKVIERGR
jgi:hypothetical protein